MSGRSYFIAGSVVGHLALAIGLGKIEVRQSHAATAIEIANVPKAKKVEPAKVEPVVQKPEPARAATRRAVPAPAPAQNTPPPPTPVAAAAEALPDFGFSLSGGVGGDGVAIPGGGGVAPRPVATERSVPVHRALAAPASVSADACEEPMIKPKARSVPQPAYSTAARAANVEGKVRVRLTVDETGKVVDVSVIQGLGYGLDEAALAAAREASFEPATLCGKAVRATFTISMRFSAG